MSNHMVEFTYKLPEWGNMEIDLDPVLDPKEKEEIAVREINDTFDDIEDIEITSIKEV